MNSTPINENEFQKILDFAALSGLRGKLEHSDPLYAEYEPNVPDAKFTTIGNLFEYYERRLNTWRTSCDAEMPGENLINIGARYYDEGISISHKEILWNYFADKQNAEILIRIRASLSENVTENRSLIRSQLRYIIGNIRKGYKISFQKEELTWIKMILNSEPEYFKSILDESSFSKIQIQFEAVKINELKLLNISSETTIREYVTRERLVEKLAEEFLLIETPDKEKTITDRLVTFKEMIEKPSIVHNWDVDKYCKAGFLISIRGENPSIASLITNNRDYTYAIPSENNVLHFEKRIHELTSGFAYSYHISYLESLLKSLKNGELPESQNLSKLPLNKFQWHGNKNQLYYLLRDLKKKGMISLSYMDLALLVKNHIEIFENTSLNTIVTELEKEQHLPKNRRLDANLGD